MKTANSIISELKQLEKMTKKQVKKAIQFLAEKQLKKHGLNIGQEVSFCQTDGYIITGVRFTDLDLRDIFIKVEMGRDWKEVKFSYGYIRAIKKK